MKNKIKKNFQKIRSILTSEKEINTINLKLLSLVFFMINSFMIYTVELDAWYKQIENPLEPEALPIILSLVFMISLISRNIIRWSFSVFGILTSLFTWLLLGSFLELMNNSGLIEYAIGTIIFSYIGMPALAGLSTIAAAAGACFAIMSTPDIDSIDFFIYFSSGFLALIFNNKTKPTVFLNNIKNEFKQNWKLIDIEHETIKSNVNIASDKIENASKAIYDASYDLIKNKKEDKGTSKSNNQVSTHRISDFKADKLKRIMDILGVRDKNLVIKKINELI